MKEKIWIEKLIRYLLESKWEEYKEEYYEWYRDVELEQNIDSLSELKPFIKWLVENDKIDISKTPWHFIYHYTDEDIVKEALMHLAIQDKPIEFLISILKNV
jgi:hypothetical protein